MLKQTIVALSLLTTGAMAQEYTFSGNAFDRNDKGVYQIDNGRFYYNDTFVRCNQTTDAHGVTTTQFQEADAGAWYNAANPDNKSCSELDQETAEQLAERVNAADNPGVEFKDWIDTGYYETTGTPSQHPPGGDYLLANDVSGSDLVAAIFQNDNILGSSTSLISREEAGRLCATIPLSASDEQDGKSIVSNRDLQNPGTGFAVSYFADPDYGYHGEFWGCLLER